MESLVNKFYDLLRSPHSLDEQTLTQIRDLATKYPYFQGVHLLLAANEEEKDIAETSSLLLPDDFSLFRFRDSIRLQQLREIRLAAEQRHVEEKLGITEEEEPNVVEGVLAKSLQSTVPLLAPTLYTLEALQTPDLEELYAYTATALNPNYTPPAASDTYAASDWKPITAEEQINLINAFLQDLDAKDGIKQRALRNAEVEAEKGVEPEDLSAMSQNLLHCESMERIAQLHESHGEYAHAIAVYKRLQEKFPEKSIYFAERIAQLNELCRPSKSV